VVTYSMKQLEFNVPDSLSEITLGQYMEIQTILDGNDDEYVIGLKMVSILCGITEGEVRGISKTDYDDISQILIKTLKSTAKWKQRYKLGDVEYGFIPSLDNLSIGEYIDLDTFVGDQDNLHKLMSILYRPIIHTSLGRYEVEKYTGNQDMDIMKYMPMDAVQGSLVFFYRLGNELLKAIPDYLIRQGVEMDIVSKQTLERSGDGIRAFTDSQTRIFWSMIELLNRTSMQPLHS